MSGNELRCQSCGHVALPASYRRTDNALAQSETTANGNRFLLQANDRLGASNCASEPRTVPSQVWSNEWPWPPIESSNYRMVHNGFSSEPMFSDLSGLGAQFPPEVAFNTSLDRDASFAAAHSLRPGAEYQTMWQDALVPDVPPAASAPESSAGSFQDTSPLDHMRRANSRVRISRSAQRVQRQRQRHQCRFPECDKDFSRATDLNRHVQNIHGQKEVFYECYYRTTRKDKMQEHCQKIHGNQRGEEIFTAVYVGDPSAGPSGTQGVETTSPAETTSSMT